MKVFRCGDVIPDCDEEIVGEEAEIFGLIANHASAVHGVNPIPDEIASLIAGKITTIPR